MATPRVLRYDILLPKLNQLSKTRKLKSNALIQWSTKAETAFQALKDALSSAALLTHSSNRANLAIMVDTLCDRSNVAAAKEGAWK